MRRAQDPEWLTRLMAGGLAAEPEIPDLRRGGGAHYATPALAEVAAVASLAGFSVGDQTSITDLTLGRGLILSTVTKALNLAGSKVDATGVEINSAVAESGGGLLEPHVHTLRVHCADVLTDDVITSGQSDLVVYEPPLNLDWKAIAPTIKERVQDGWFPHGTGTTRDAAWLFLQRGLAALKREDAGGGRLVTFMTETNMLGSPGRGIRQQLLDEDVVEAVVRLPGGLAASTEIPLYLLVLRYSKPLRGHARVVDLRPYLTTQDRGKRRRIGPEGLRMLWTALETRAMGPDNRVVDLKAFTRRTVQVAADGAVDPLTWRTDVLDAQIEEGLLRRYGPIPIRWHPQGDSTVSFDVTPHFSGRGARRRPADHPHTRLSALLSAAPRVFRPGDPTQGQAASIYVPTGRGTVTTTPPVHKGRVLHLQVRPEYVHPEYLAGWLNSDEGGEVLRTALDRSASGTIIRAVRSSPAALWQFVDELTVPLPPLDKQRHISDALLTLRRVENLVQSARADVWADHRHVDLVVSPFEPLLDQSLERWAGSLPYPFATALWTLTSRSTVEARHRQVFHTWESYAAFLATVLLSVLRQDGDLADIEGPALRRSLAKADLSLEKPTFGAWNIVAQRLSATFRSMLGRDPDQRVRVSEMFGGAPTGVVSAILDPAVIDLLADVNSKRNAWLGHSGATSVAALQTQIDYLTNALEALRSLVGEAWTRIPLVRAGRATQRRGQLTQEVELVMGTSVPFMPTTLTVGRMMDEGELYLVTDGAARPVPLSHLIVLRASPADERYSCYFFNRADSDSVRLVSYQLTESGEIVEPRSAFAEDLSWLWVE